MSEWQPIETAPRDRSYVLVKMREDAFSGSRFEHYAGRCFVAYHEGKTHSGYDMGWGLFPGFGGVPDSEIEGWMPLPPPPAALGALNNGGSDG